MFYSVLDDRVLGWVVRKDGITFFQRSVRESELGTTRQGHPIGWEHRLAREFEASV